jgi:hypothetical protein
MQFQMILSSVKQLTVLGISGLLSVREAIDHLCDLVVRVPGYRSRGPISIPGATRFSEK